MKLENISVSVTEPVSLAEAKAHLRVDHADEDAYISALIPAARRIAEHHRGGPIPVQSYRLTLDSFPAALRLPEVPLVAVSSIAYTDAEGAAQTLVDYKLSHSKYHATIEPLYGESWPTVQDSDDVIVIEWSAGYSSAPENIKQAILLVIGTLYETREDTSPLQTYVVPFGAKALLMPDMVPST